MNGVNAAYGVLSEKISMQSVLIIIFYLSMMDFQWRRYFCVHYGSISALNSVGHQLGCSRKGLMKKINT